MNIVTERTAEINTQNASLLNVFLGTLHQGAPHRYLWTHDGRYGTTHSAPTATPVSSIPSAPAVYFGVHGMSVPLGPRERGGNGQVSTINCVFGDFDAKDTIPDPTETELAPFIDQARADAKGQPSAATLRRLAIPRYKKHALAQDFDYWIGETKRTVDALDPPPSYVIYSGGGYHCYWLFSHTQQITTETDRARMAALSKNWVGFVGADPSVHDLNRVLRLPGSFNNKYGQPMEVEFQKFAPSLTYSHSFLEQLCTPDQTDSEIARSAAKPANVARGNGYQGESVIDAFNDANNVCDLLSQYGYEQSQHKPTRWKRPGGASYSIIVDGGTSYHFSDSDPLCSAHDGRQRDAFDVWANLEHSGDYTAAVRAAAALLGMSRRQPPAAPATQPPAQLLEAFIAHGTIPVCDDDKGNAQRALGAAGVAVEVARGAGVRFTRKPIYKAFATQQSASELRGVGLPPAKGKIIDRGWGAALVGGRKGQLVFPYYEDGILIDVRTLSLSDADGATWSRPRTANERTQLYGQLLPGLSVHIVANELQQLALYGQGVPALAMALDSGRLEGWKREYAGLLSTKVALVDMGDPVWNIYIGRNLRACNVATYILSDTGRMRVPEYEQLHSEAAQAAPGATMDPGTRRHSLHPDTPLTEQQRPHSARERMNPKRVEWELRARIRSYLKRWTPGDPPFLVIVPPGFGKTTIATEIAKEAAALRGWGVFTAEPTVKQSENVASDHFSEFGDVVVYSRNVDNCERHDEANIAIRKGYNPVKTTCTKCPLFNEGEPTCDYFAGLHPRIYATGTLAHLHTALPPKIIGDGIIIADELNENHMIETIEISYDDLCAVRDNELTTGWAKRVVGAWADLLHNTKKGLLDGHELYTELEGVFSDLMGLEWIEALTPLQMTLDIMADEDVSENMPHQFAAALINMMIDDVRRIKAGRLPSGRLWVEHDQIVLKRLRPLKPWADDMPMVILNATVDPEVLAVAMQRKLSVFRADVAIQDSNTIRQHWDLNNAQSSFLEDGGAKPEVVERMARRIREIMIDESDTTIIATKTISEIFQRIFDRAKHAHYGALDGRDDLQSTNTILINPPAVNETDERGALAALRYDPDWRNSPDPDPDFGTTRLTRVFEQRDSGDLYAVEQRGYRDPLSQKICETLTDGAIAQAAGRARMIHNGGRFLDILCSRPVPGVEPDHVIGFYDPIPGMAGTGQAKPEQARPAFDKLLQAGQELRDAHGVFIPAQLQAAAGVSLQRTRDHFSELCEQLGMADLTLPCINHLGVSNDTFRIAIYDEKTGQPNKCPKTPLLYNTIIVGMFLDTSLSSQIIAVENHETLQRLQQVLPANWTINVPVKPAKPKRRRTTLEELREQENKQRYHEQRHGKPKTEPAHIDRVEDVVPSIFSLGDADTTKPGDAKTSASVRFAYKQATENAISTQRGYP